jgi:hypothetical protein
MFRRFSILLAMAVIVPLATAQMRGGMGRVGFGAHMGSASGHRGAHSLNRGGSFLGSPFFYPDYDFGGQYADDSSPVSPPLVVVQRPADDSPRRTKPAPLLIEWRGDRYVRFGGAREEESGTSAHPDYSESTASKLPAASGQTSTSTESGRNLPPAVVVYRNGRREEISDYAIADGVIYVRASYRQDGYGTKHIQLSSLDLPSTLQANQQRGVKFLLPSESNVVTASF